MDARIVHRWVRKPRKIGENLDVNDQQLSGSHVTTTHDLNGQKKNQQSCARKSTNFSKGGSGLSP